MFGLTNGTNNWVSWFDERFNFESLGQRTYWRKIIDGQEVMIINVAGFEKKDLEINTKTEDNDYCSKEYLWVKGTPNDNIKNILEEFNVKIELKPGIVKIDCKVENGLLYIEFVKEKKPEYKISF